MSCRSGLTHRGATGTSASAPAASALHEESTMDTAKVRSIRFGPGKEYQLDEYGFLAEPERWDEDFAQGMARIQGIYGGLTQAHWDFIAYIRQKALAQGTLPLLVVACA
ncbi:MAG TPA: hypothetical protein EYP56_10635, partial [Planctomycetaceae bacterium]|nr:hypothetical protein [Planctomycetaceae bacterium]